MGKAPIAAARLPQEWRRIAEKRATQAGERLTPARLAAYAELKASSKPLSAYELIARLERRQDRKIAPLTVYRHLDFLLRIGLIHRLQSTQSYLVCDHPDEGHQSQYLLCSECGSVDEVESASVDKALGNAASARGFTPQHATVEVTGLCGNCTGAVS
ncbi:MAG: Fur family transcriptional regulator [Pseudomonadota bacterium]